MQNKSGIKSNACAGISEQMKEILPRRTAMALKK